VQVQAGNQLFSLRPEDIDEKNRSFFAFSLAVDEKRGNLPYPEKYNQEV